MVLMELKKGDTLNVKTVGYGHTCHRCNRQATRRVSVAGNPVGEIYLCDFDADMLIADAKGKGVGVLGDGMIRL